MSAPVYSETKARDMAKLVLTKTLQVRPGQAVTIETWDNTLPWATAFVLEARRLRALPLLLYNDEATYWKSVEVAGPKSLGQAGRHEWAMLERTDAYVFFWGPSDTVREERLPEETAAAMTAWEERWFEIANRSGVRMARLYLGRVGAASARAYGVDPDEWQRELVEATMVDPAQMHRTALKVAERLRKGKSLEVRHPNGTDLRLGLRHREPRIESGVLPLRARTGRPRQRGHPGLADVNVPAGSVIVAVDEGSGDGRFVASEPTDSLQGPLTGGVWEIREGRLVSHSYRSGGGAFERQYLAAGPRLGTPGAVLIGLNPKIRQAPMMRDQRLGAVSFTLGGNRFWGGETDGHGFHPYLTLHEAELLVDGKPVVQPAG